METIYLDHNATTPTRPEVVEAMVRCYRDGHANPASSHRLGQRARQQLEEAREGIAAIVGAETSGALPDRVIFTSGGTEANNLAILGAAQADGHEPGQLIVSAVEHPSILEPAEHLLARGWRLDTLPVSRDGVVQSDFLRGLLGEHTRLVSVILGNHDTGVLQPASELAQICNEAGVVMHTDAVQAAGKAPIHFRQLGVAAMSLAAHKFQGPLGIGALVLRNGVLLEPLLFGGHQQGGIRPGTESVVLAVGMHTALRLWQEQRDAEARRLQALRDSFEQGLAAGFPGLVVNGQSADRLPNTSSVAFPGTDGQVLLMALDMAGIACSVGSACSSGSTELSPTLRAMGLPQEVVVSSLRFSLGATTTRAEVDEAVRRILHVVDQLA